MGAATNSMYNLGFFQQLFGAPNGWSVDKSGKFTSALETEATKEALAYLRQLVGFGVFHPQSNTGPPWVYVDSMYPDFIKTVHNEMEQLAPLGVSNPTVGL